MKPTVIYVDIDEVLADWIGALFRLLGLEPTQVHAAWDSMSPRPWDVCEVLGKLDPKLTANTIWRSIDACGERFWADIYIFPWAHDLVRACQAYAPVVLLTSPSLHPSSHAGKAQWIQTHFGRDFRDYLIGSCKHRCAHPNAVLIDDSPSNCERFQKHGGLPILFPSACNDLYHIPTNKRVQTVTHVLDEIASWPD